MDTGTLVNAVWGAVFVVILIVLVGRARGRRSNAPRRPEYPDGNLPDLESPHKPAR